MAVPCTANSVSPKECQPIKNLAQLLNFRKYICRCDSTPKNSVCVPLPDRPRVLLCHDFKNGYQMDRYHVKDREELKKLPKYNADQDYYFDEWNKIDVFVYFSHHFVSVPPCSWIKQAHSNGVKVLGTFLIEWDTKLIVEVLSEENLPKVIQNLVDLCVENSFEGYLFNMEVTVPEHMIGSLKHLVKTLTEELRKKKPGSLVIWYDSVINTGKIKYLNELATPNEPFFSVCDGIYTNYKWSATNIDHSIERAKERKNDVYMGIDVWSRDVLYNAGFETSKLVQQVLKKCSAAVFAPGWVLESQSAIDFPKNQKRFWDPMPNPGEKCKPNPDSQKH